MNKDYLSQITSTKLKKALLRAENIGPLEEILRKEIENLRFLRKLKRDKLLDFGEIWDIEEVVELFPKVKVKVDTLLDVHKISKPLLEYSISTGYDDVGLTLILAEEEITNVIPGIVHEYVHHIQHKCGIPIGLKSDKYLSEYATYAIFVEGHARGIERYIAADFMMQEKNEAYLFEIIERTVVELKKTYSWMCHVLNKPIKKSLTKIQSKLDICERLPVPSQHALGNTLFFLYEKLKGPKVYNDAIHGKLRFD